MEERVGLFRDYDTGVFSVSDLCRRYDISRETFYVWKHRRESGDDDWFEGLSHAVEHCPHATSDQPAAFQDHCTVGDATGLRNIVSNDHRSRAALADYAQNELLNRPLGSVVER